MAAGPRASSKFKGWEQKLLEVMWWGGVGEFSNVERVLEASRRDWCDL